MADSLRRVALLAAALACVSCSDEKRKLGASPDDDGTDSGRQPRDGGARGDGAPAQPSGTDAGAEPDPTANQTFETARSLTVGGRREFQDIVQPFQTAYFYFKARGGVFYELASYVTPYSPNNVMSLYDADQILIGENDLGERWPGDRMIDTRLVVRFEHDGVYYVKLTDPELGPASFDNPGFPDYFYYVSARELAAGTPGTGFESADTDFVPDAFSGLPCATLLGEFHDGSSAVFNFAGKEGQALIGQALVSGVHGNGSTASGGELSVTSEQGTILADIDRAHGQSDIHPPIGEGSYTLTAAPTGNLGDNAFYAVDLVMLPENPMVHTAGDNGAIAAAEAIDMKGTWPRRGLLLAKVEGSEVEYYSFDAKAQETVIVVCEAESAGSGVRKLHAEVRDADDAVLASAVETATANLSIEPFLVESTGPHYLRIWSESASASAIDPWVRCAVNVGR
jgi:hypothetical protein